MFFVNNTNPTIEISNNIQILLHVANEKIIGELIEENDFFDIIDILQYSDISIIKSFFAKIQNNFIHVLIILHHFNDYFFDKKDLYNDANNNLLLYVKIFIIFAEFIYENKYDYLLKYRFDISVTVLDTINVLFDEINNIYFNNNDNTNQNLDFKYFNDKLLKYFHNTYSKYKISYEIYLQNEINELQNKLKNIKNICK